MRHRLKENAKKWVENNINNKPVTSNSNQARYKKNKCTYSNGDVYEGDWSKGKMNGQGILRLASGLKFKGSFKDGFKNGPCVEEDKDGLRFEGSYKDGVKDGPFVEKDRNGNVVRKGTYRNGKIIEE